MIEFRSGDGWNGLIYFIFKSYLVINLGQKEKREDEEEKKETSPRSAGKSFHTKEQDCTNKTDSVPRFQGFQLLFRRAQEGIGAETGLCVCVKQIRTLLLHDSVPGPRLTFHFSWREAHGLSHSETCGGSVLL